MRSLTLFGRGAAAYLFMLAAFGQQFSTILDFQSGEMPAVPRTALVAGAQGVLYGSGQDGVFELDPPAVTSGAWTEKTILSLPEVYGSPIAIGPHGELYGAAEYVSYSEVFQLTPPASAGGDWTQTVVYTWPDRMGGWQLAAGADGTVYGATTEGGTSGNGMVFALTPPASAGGSWTETVIYNFSGQPDGMSPTGLTLGADGTIYGTVEYGGKRGRGGVFALTPPAAAGGAWTEEMLYSFKGQPDAANPVGGLTMGRDGALYGVSVLGGTAARGTVFRLRPPATAGGRWRESVLYSFQGMPDGQHPSPGLAIGRKGAIYGATLQGGKSAGRCQRTGCGTVFQLTPSATAGGPWNEKLLETFPCGKGGCQPVGGLVNGSDGKVYGTTSSGGGRSNGGTAFQVQP